MTTRKSECVVGIICCLTTLVFSGSCAVLLWHISRFQELHPSITNVTVLLEDRYNDDENGWEWCAKLQIHFSAGNLSWSLTHRQCHRDKAELDRSIAQRQFSGIDTVYLSPGKNVVVGGDVRGMTVVAVLMGLVALGVAVLMCCFIILVINHSENRQSHQAGLSTVVKITQVTPPLSQCPS